MTRALLILAVVVMGCGSPQPCEPTVIDGGNFLGDLATDWGRAKGLFASSEVTTEQEFCSAFGGMVVTVKDSEFVDESAGMRGEYSMFSGITLGNDGLSLAHELLHAWDSQHWAVGTSTHAGWDTNGYNALASEFMVQTIISRY